MKYLTDKTHFSQGNLNMQIKPHANNQTHIHNDI